jgi:hypothetical protein
MASVVFEGSIVALVTPFRNGRFDRDAYAELIEWHVRAGTRALVACGTTGEAPTLTEDEFSEVVKFTVERAKGRSAGRRRHRHLRHRRDDPPHEGVRRRRLCRGDGRHALLQQADAARTEGALPGGRRRVADSR